MLSDEERLRNVEWLRSAFSEADFDEPTALLAVADLFRSIWWDNITHHLPCDSCAPEYRPEDAERVMEQVVSDLELYFHDSETKTLEEDGMVLMFLLETLATMMQQEMAAQDPPQANGRPTYRTHGDVIEVDFGQQSPEAPPNPRP